MQELYRLQLIVSFDTIAWTVKYQILKAEEVITTLVVFHNVVFQPHCSAFLSTMMLDVLLLNLVATINGVFKKREILFQKNSTHTFSWNFKAFPEPLPPGIYLLKVNNGKTRIMCEIYSKLTIKIFWWFHFWLCSSKYPLGYFTNTHALMMLKNWTRG